MTTPPALSAAKRPLAVIAIGGNSLIADDKKPDIPHQWDAVRETAIHIAELIESGWDAVVTHGNGPQVGFILRRSELAQGEVHQTPLDLIVADTQGAIGYMLQQALNNEFFRRKVPRQCVTLITQTRVDRDDPAFARPTKPIGSFMDEATARRFEAEGWRVMEDAGRGWRRVVASPQPVEIVEEAAIMEAVAAGWIVIAMGGGGVPVTRNSEGELRGISAVIDKDLGSSFLARRIGADLFLISTGVEQVALDFGKPTQRNVAEMTVAEARQRMDEGHFAPGSMKPKIDAAIRFVEQSQNPNAYALITNPTNLGRALQGATGTRVVP